MKLVDCLVRNFRTPDQDWVRELVLRGLGERFGSIDRSLNPDLDDIAANYHKKGTSSLLLNLSVALSGVWVCLGNRPAFTALSEWRY